MNDTVTVYNQYEAKPVYWTFTPDAGTLAVQTTATGTGIPGHVPSGPIVTLTDAAGAVAGTIDGVAATDYDAGDQAAPRVWFHLDTAEPRSGQTALAKGTYVLELVVYMLGKSALAAPEGFTRRYVRRTGIVIE